MTRRRVLAFIVGAIALIAMKLVGRALLDRSDGDAPDPTPAARRLVVAVDQGESAAAIGEAVLASSPESPSVQGIVGTLSRRLAIAVEKMPDTPIDQLRRKIEGHIRAEHLAGDTVSVAGWELAFTEAQLYALAALLRH